MLCLFVTFTSPMKTLGSITFRSHKPFLIAGPCSAESPEQLAQVAVELKTLGVQLIRAGVWKPRTRPGVFEGMGSEALNWIADVKAASGMPFTTEVAQPSHVEQALKAGVDVLWLGARTTVNPFLVQEIAESLKGTRVPVMVKNPVNPEVALWIGAMERVMKSGDREVAAVHRGFSVFEPGRYRNAPLWQLAIEFRQRMPQIPLFADPSHIGGQRAMVPELAQRALDLDYDGLMIEVHPDPEKALSDAAQQLNLKDFAAMLRQLVVRQPDSDNAEYHFKLQELRQQIDQIDQELLQVLRHRMEVVEQIGDYKRENNVAVFQKERWSEILKSRPDWAGLHQLSPKWVAALYNLIHEESIRKQTEIVNLSKSDTSGTV